MAGSHRVSGFRRARGRSGLFGLVTLVALGLCSWSGGPFQPSTTLQMAFVGTAESVNEESAPAEEEPEELKEEKEPAPAKAPAPAPAPALIEALRQKGMAAYAKLGSVSASVVASRVVLLAAIVVAASARVARQEPPPPPPPVVPVEKRSDLPRVAVLAVLLSLVSGMVNATAILQMGGTVAHHTGNASHTGRLAGVDGARFATLMLSYFFGAALTGFRKSNGENPLIGKPSPALLGSAIAVAGGAIIHWASGNSLVALPVLAFSQGIHNGVTSRFSSMPLRTTHVTGTLTDTGAACGAWLRSKFHGDAPPSAAKTGFLLLALLAFAAGGVLAKMCCDRMGSLAALPPAAVLAILARGVIPCGRDTGEKKD